MIKKLLFTAALLVPGLAFGQNPSADLSVQVVPGTPSGIACAIGPNYMGTVPPGAAAAGFNTCAANIDFTNPALASLSSWLDAAGAATPLMYLQYPTGCWNLALGLSSYAMISDGGIQTLNINIPSGTATGAGVTAGACIHTTNRAQNAGQLFPQTKYIEYSYRVGTNSQSVCAAAGVQCDFMAFYQYVLSGNPAGFPFVEWDYTEVYAGASQPIATGTTGAPPNFTNITWAQALTAYALNSPTGHPAKLQLSGVDQTLYHHYAVRIVSDGAASLDGTTDGNTTYCFYEGDTYPPTLQGCSHGLYSNAPANGASDSMAARESQYLEMAIPPNVTLSGRLDVYFRYFRIWECSNWQAATGVTRLGNNCLNTSADVSGRLTGAP